ncbi:MAG: hypothetical protein PHF11_03585 [Candidatus Omnitrophica bacterium]|nr:hypothetical protein [Candidatus Omnitrophota bacterium]
MRNISAILVLLSVFFLLNIRPGYSQTVPSAPASKETAVKTVDVNKDGTPDITYYGDGKHITRIEADTNYDGKPDVVVHNKDGKFASAEADTDYNGTMETKFSDVAAFNKWLNANSPDFNDKLDKTDWQFDLFKF